MKQPKRPPVSRAVVKAVWDSFEKPTLDKVCKTLIASGILMTPDKLRTWVRQGFKEPDGEGPPQQAIDRLDIALPVLSKNPQIRLSELVPTIKVVFDARRSELEQMTDDALMRLHARTVAIAATMVGEEMIRQREHLIRDCPSEFASLVTAWARLCEVPGDAYQQSNVMQDRLMRIQEIVDDRAALEDKRDAKPEAEILPPIPVNDPLAEELAKWSSLSAVKVTKTTTTVSMKRNGNGGPPPPT